MEVAYSVGVSNRFASLMDEDDDPGDQLISAPGALEKVVKEKQRKEVKSGKQKDNREKEQQTRKGAQDPTKRTCMRTVFDQVILWARFFSNVFL